MGILSSIGRSIFGESTVDKAERITNEDPFRMNFSLDAVTLEDGTELEVLKLQVRGLFNSRIHTFEKDSVMSSVLILAGETEDEMKPVICAMEDYQFEETPFFHFALPEIKANYGLFGGWDEWITLFTVPVASLTFARKGNLLIKAKFIANLLIVGRSYERSAVLRFQSDEIGYIDGIEQRERAMEIAVSLAVLVAGVDGSHDSSEAAIVKEFISKHLNEIDDADRRSTTKKALNDAASDAFARKSITEIKSNGMYLAEEAAGFESNLKFMIMELLLDVAGADDVAESAETEFLNSLAHKMGMDVAEYKNMRDKALPISIYAQGGDGESSGQIEDMLGIRAGMTTAEKKSQLSKEYRKWNALKNSSDPVKSKQAKEMVRAISNLRKGL